MKILLVVLALLLASPAHAVILVGFGAGTLQTDASYSESNNQVGEEAYLCSVYATESGQSFSSGGGVLDSAKFYLHKTGSPTGNATAKVYAHTGTYGTSSLPTGSVLATSDTFDVSTLTASNQLITFSFSGANRITLASSYYFVVVSYSGGDADNIVHPGRDASSPTHDGNAADDYGGWTATATHDQIFYVYVVR